MGGWKSKRGSAQTTFVQVVHYGGERGKTVTCEEISGMGPRGEEIKEGKKERKKTDKERVKLPEGRRKEGYCACALTGCMMKLLFCVVCSD